MTTPIPKKRKITNTSTSTAASSRLKSDTVMTQLSSSCPASPHLDRFPAVTLYNSIIIVKVGLQKKEFSIYKDVLSHHSSYFNTALNSRFKEGVEGAIELPDDDVDTFQASYSWLYICRLFEAPAEAETIPLSFRQLCKIFILGDMRGVPTLKNAAIDAIIAKFADEWAMPTKHIQLIYDNTLEDSPLRKLVVSMAILGHLDFQAWFKRNASTGDITKEYLQDLVIALDKFSSSGAVRKNGPEVWASINKCDYHDHSEPNPAASPKTGKEVAPTE